MVVQSGRNSIRIAEVLVLLAVLAAAGIAVGYGFGYTVSKPPPVTVISTTTTSATATSNSSAPYDLTLVITTNNVYNSTIGEQPAYFVLGPSGLQSSANISLPADRLIRLTIICYDNGTANLTNAQDAVVTGTVNNTVDEVSNDNVNSSQGAAGIQVVGGQTISSLSPDDIAHTFTIPQLGINIPILPSATVTAYFKITQTGTFSWFCMTECGAGPSGLQGAMTTPGWMTGNLVVS